MEPRLIEVHPATPERFDDVAAVLAPRSPDVPTCWCLSMRLPNAENHALRGADRGARLRRYAEEGTPPGVVAYVDGEPAGWCSIAPRSSHHRLTHSRTIPTVDDVPVWSIVCLVVRPRFRRRGLARHLLDGAVDYARSRGAPVVEAYPVDPGERRLSSAFAYMGTMSLFEAAGFVRVAETSARAGGAPRWLVRLDLSASAG
ncbi:GCN5-related protein N-acetyltransferase [Beutenbergia cavernae DSM 12333]|uniref:GCN5-related protein N-acetyltransferase n=1 Tax=Beutenbergia cavernae (strain ATCC BAA-8 / DSM 12333 / CCUG 43141 / JCM 11478 / NBRC 16432 / NCIMB 13614 / HKI 0122) TaxID=471853 RepID=C5C3C4_BEUC1|nr:GNAT family N-acetyltransferase [Beutenbergia cavernae]ACQ79823.1 GCN5-related protein N-acetyltransferase [Beutenbergia cavernae DSM 12333]